MKNAKTPGNIAARVRELVLPAVSELGYELWDVTFEKTGTLYELTVYIDADKTIGIDDCEKVSRALDPIIDRHDPIPQAYTFYVSSAGLERALTQAWHFEKCAGREVEVGLFRQVDGAKRAVGTLTSYMEGDVTISSDGEERTFKNADIAFVRLFYRGET